MRSRSLSVQIEGKELTLVEGDITDLDVDVIVNAANRWLKLGGGVAGAIRRKGGPEIQRECDEVVRRRGPLKVGEAALTGAGRLKAKYVVHAVGPIYGEGDEEAKLRSAVLNSLKIAEEIGAESIAFPAISTGVYRYPLRDCARIMIPTLLNYLREGKIKKVVICLYTEDAFSVFEEELKRLIGNGDRN